MWRTWGILAMLGLATVSDRPVALAQSQSQSAWQKVSFPLPSGQMLQAHWLPAADSEHSAAHPAIVALHGCGGLYTQGGRLAVRYRETGARLHAAGYGVLLPDSFGSRGMKHVCSTRYGERALNVEARANDVQAALAWLAQQGGVDALRLGVQGWSNGASTALKLLEVRQAKPDVADVPLAGVAVFYPGCGPLLRRHAQLEPVPLLMQLGAADDWTPAKPCEELAQTLRSAGHDVTLHVYADSYHGFDGTEPVRLRTDVPNGVSGQEVHQGGNPVARVQSQAALGAFWSHIFGLRGHTP